jgi:hypothetical protein
MCLLNLELKSMKRMQQLISKMLRDSCLMKGLMTHKRKGKTSINLAMKMFMIKFMEEMS